MEPTLKKRSTPLATLGEAAIVTLLFSVCYGVLIVLFDYVIVMLGDRMLEAVGVIGRGWGNEHLWLLLEAAGFASIPLILFVSYRLFRRAIREVSSMNAGGH